MFTIISKQNNVINWYISFEFDYLYLNYSKII